MNKPRAEREGEETLGRVLIADRDALAAIILDVVGSKFDGNISAAARWVRDELDPTLGRLSQPTLQRLSKGTSQSIEELTVWGLVALVGQENLKRLGWTILSPSARERLDEFESVCSRRGLGSSEQRKHFRDRLLEQMRGDHDAEFGKFDRTVRASGHSTMAVDLALDRVVEPFVLAREGGFIEREWDELSEPERRKYVKCALKREIILLTRPPDLRRAQTPRLQRLFGRGRPPKTLADFLTGT